MKLNELFISEKATIREAMEKIDETAKKILLVTENNMLIGSITDGDIRRWILKNGDLRECVNLIMNKAPFFILEKDRPQAKKILKERAIEAIPIVNMQKEIIDIIFWNDKFNHKFNYYDKLDNKVVIMAGGMGTRLEPYTKILPKPLIPIGDIPIVERIINRFVDYGCNKFYLTVNHKKNMIKAYFNEFEKTYDIDYVEEENPLGTAGSLNLLKDKLNETFFVSNCDILIDGNYSDMIKYHKENCNKITIITSLKHYIIPYGVIEINEDSYVKNLIEKPEYDYLVNTGMYILEPELLDVIPKDTFYHITELIKYCIDKEQKVGIYPVSDKSWLDMGQFKEMQDMLERLGIK